MASWVSESSGPLLTTAASNEPPFPGPSTTPKVFSKPRTWLDQAGAHRDQLATGRQQGTDAAAL